MIPKNNTPIGSLVNRITEISKKHNLSHLGSCYTSIAILDEIYSEKKDDEVFIASCGHMGLSQYIILEKFYGFDAEQLYLKHGTHPNRSIEDKIYCSTGSLGMGISIALGMAIANRDKNVYCLISDGESFEGVIWEVANVVYKYNITNLKLYCNFNKYGAYDEISESHINRLKSIFPCYINKGGMMKIVRTKVEDYGLKGLEAHYISADKL